MSHSPYVDPGVVLAKATARSSVLLGLSEAALSRVIGVSEPTMSGADRGPAAESGLQGGGTRGAAGTRVPLSGLAGRQRRSEAGGLDEEPQRGLGGVPANLVEKVEGLVNAASYLERAQVPAQITGRDRE
jgi:hypothetical protein